MPDFRTPLMAWAYYSQHAIFGGIPCAHLADYYAFLVWGDR